MGYKSDFPYPRSLNTPKIAKGFGIGFVAIWLFSALISIAFIGVIIWAIIALVLHFTG